MMASRQRTPADLAASQVETRAAGETGAAAVEMAAARTATRGPGVRMI